MSAYRTSAVAHADVALDVEGGRAGEPEGLHVRVDDGLGCNLIDISYVPESVPGSVPSHI